MISPPRQRNCFVAFQARRQQVAAGAGMLEGIVVLIDATVIKMLVAFGSFLRRLGC